MTQPQPHRRGNFPTDAPAPALVRLKRHGGLPDAIAGMRRVSIRHSLVMSVLASVLLAASSLASNVMQVRVGNHPTFTRVVFELDSPAGYRIVKGVDQGTHELVVTLEASSSPRSVRSGSPEVGLVSVQEGARATQAHIRLRNANAGVKEMILNDPPRIVIDLMREPSRIAAEKAAVQKRAAAKAAKTTTPDAKPAETTVAETAPVVKPTQTAVAPGSDVKAAEAKAAAQKAADVKAVEAKAAETKAAEAKAAEATAAAQKVAEANAAESKAAEAKAAAKRAAEAKAAEAKLAEAKVAEAKAAAQRAAEAKAAEAKLAEAKATEAKAAEAKLAEAKVAEAKVVEAKLAEAKAAASKAAEAKTAPALAVTPLQTAAAPQSLPHSFRCRLTNRRPPGWRPRPPRIRRRPRKGSRSRPRRLRRRPLPRPPRRRGQRRRTPVTNASSDSSRCSSPRSAVAYCCSCSSS